MVVVVVAVVVVVVVVNRSVCLCQSAKVFVDIG